MLLENSHALVGTLAEATISSLYAGICFFSSQGIPKDGVISDFSEDETRLRKCMIKHAKKSVFLFDRSKLGKQFMFQVCHADELFQIISDT
jgi:DeoR/GlpR family transcriptional regulator of sugar metabolism